MGHELDTPAFDLTLHNFPIRSLTFQMRLLRSQESYDEHHTRHVLSLAPPR